MGLAMLIATAGGAIAAGDVAGVSGIDSASSSAVIGTTATMGGGGSSFAAPAGTDSGPGLVSNLIALAQPGSTPAAGIVLTEIPPNLGKPSEPGTGALPPSTDLGLPAER